jgi:hypothetical protein
MSAWPAASTSTLINATLAPPNRSGRWPKTTRAMMKAAANALKAS